MKVFEGSMHYFARETILRLHDILNTQGFAMHYGVISKKVSNLEVFQCERANAWTGFFSHVELFRGKDLLI